MFRKLKGKLRELDMTQADLCKKLARSHTYISERMTGKKSWELDDCYDILRIIGEPYSAINEYFPRHGQSVMKEDK